jgi:ectoine hydroxylase-related dioxygenase (phytanoyl-CoA dioxygenase family)
MQSVVSCLFDEPILYEKSPLRVDVPFDLREMTLWHQDFYYVKGSVDVVTFYMPLNDLDYLGGALSICPGSHKLGPLPHDLKWGKKSYPSYAGSLASMCCELAAGSALVFNSLLLHQTNPNYSELVNFNIQYRVSDKQYLHNPQMGNLIPIPNPSPNTL